MTGGNKNPKESLKKVAALYNDQLARPVKAVAAPPSVATAAKKAKRSAGLDIHLKNRAK
jgi:hypothetical protein